MNPALLVAGAAVPGVGFVVVAVLGWRRGVGRAPLAWPAVVGAGLVTAAGLLLAGAPAVAERLVLVVLGLSLPGLALTFPTGRFDRGVDRVAAVVVLLAGVVLVALPGGVVATTAGVVLLLALAAGMWFRFERSEDLVREQVLWLLLGTGGAGVVGGHLLFAAEALPPAGADVLVAVTVVGSLAAPAGVAFALFAPRALDVRTLISEVASAVVMLDLALGVYTGSLAAVELLGSAPAPPIVVPALVVVVAAGFHPARVAVRATLDQVLFGGRPDPVGVVSTLGDELSRGGGPAQWLDALCAAADLPGAQLRRGSEVVATSGSPGPPGHATATVPLRVGDELVGDLVVGLPAHHRELPRPTEAVVRLVGPPLARAVQSTRLAAELQESRRMVVLAAEDERRRLRRDLHDGLGPVLTGVAYTADAARNVLAARPDRAADLLNDLRGDVAGAIEEIRRIVHDLRPPVLDQLGLVAALRQHADRTAETTGLTVTVSAPAVGNLPAAVEVVAYRVAVEAVHNAVRHAAARTVTVTLSPDDDALDLGILDDGCGGDWRPGVGLTTMRERVEQVGGRFSAAGGPTGGRVRARLPMPSQTDEMTSGVVDSGTRVAW